MRLLLDTHVVLWWLKGDTTELSAETIGLLRSEPAIYVSPISTFEIALKRARGKLEVPAGLLDDIAVEFSELPIRHEHTRLAAALPDIHRDPFDRILIAQARAERLTLVTRDAKIHRYDVDSIEV